MPTKLTYEQAVAIRLDPRPQREIAEEYGVALTTISNIHSGRSWKAVNAVVPAIHARRDRLLTPDQARDVRSGNSTVKELSERYGTSRTCIQRIIRGETYKR